MLRKAEAVASNMGVVVCWFVLILFFLKIDR